MKKHDARSNPSAAACVSGGSLASTGLLLLLMALLAMPAAAQRGARVLHRNLAELVDDAYTIVRGRVIAVRAEPHPEFTRLDSVVVTFEVFETLKGPSDAQMTFRLFVMDARDSQSHLGYKAGQELLLFMNKPSNIGFSSPAGLEQGRFRFQQDAQGNRRVVNGWNNMGLFRNIEQKAPKLQQQASPPARQLLAQHRDGPIAYSDLKDLVTTLMATRGE